MKTFDLGAVTAYALAVKHGFEGTEAEWVAHMQANATQATEAEANAKQYAENAKTSETNAGKSAQAAQTAEQSASQSAQNAAKSAEEAKKAEGVKSVNGKTPDENGNVEIDSVASWNDLTDKPFGEVGGMVEILPECQTVAVEGMDDFWIDKPCKKLTVGESYIVNWNGVEYAATAYDGSEMDMPYPYLVNNEADMSTGEGAVFIICAGDVTEDVYYGFAMPADGTTTPIISIKQEQTITKTIDPKYLPDGVPYVVEDSGVELLPVSGEWQTDESGAKMFVGMEPIGLEIGKTYTVNWNGVAHIVTAVDGTEAMGGLSCVGLGNLTEAEDGEPFVVMELSAETSEMMGGMYVMASGRNGAEVPFSIYSGIIVINKLDNRCLDLAWLPIVEKIDTEVLAETTFTDYNNNKTLKPSSLPVGTKVAVIYDGVRYECTVALLGAGSDTATYFGNIGLGDASYPNTGEPFFFLSLTAASPYQLNRDPDAEGNPTVAVYTFNESHNTMPADFLPTDATVFHLTSPNGTKFAVTVADDGTLSASAVTE